MMFSALRNAVMAALVGVNSVPFSLESASAGARPLACRMAAFEQGSSSNGAMNHEKALPLLSTRGLQQQPTDRSPAQTANVGAVLRFTRISWPKRLKSRGDDSTRASAELQLAAGSGGGFPGAGAASGADSGAAAAGARPVAGPAAAGARDAGAGAVAVVVTGAGAMAAGASAACESATIAGAGACQT